MGKTTITHEIYLNGQLLDAVTSFSWDNYPSHEYQEFTDVGTVHGRRIKLTNYKKGSGTISLLAPIGTYSNDPMSLIDALGFRDRYSTYNTTTEKVEIDSTIYDWDPDSMGTLDKPLVPHEIRQTETNDETSIDSDGDQTKISQRFRAHCTDLTTLKLKLRDEVGAEVTSVRVEVWTDSSGLPNAKLTGSSSVDASGLSITDGTGYADADWVEIDISSIMGTAHLTPGTYYHIVLEALDTDPLYINTTSNNRYTPGGMGAYTGSWGSVSGDLTFILQGTDSYGGHNLIIYDYTSGKTAYTKYTCYGTDVYLTDVNITPKEHITANLKFESERIETTKG